MSDYKVNIVVAVADKASKPLSGIGKALGGLGGGSTLANITRVTVGLGGLGLAVRSVAREAADAELVQAQLVQVLKSTEGAAGVTAEAANELSDSLSKVTRFDDEAILSGENLLLTFTKIGEEVFPQATEAALDMSTAMGQDLNASIMLIGKALNDPIQGMTALRRVGVQLTDAQEELVRKMVEAGNVMGAQKVILQELQTEFGGSARAAGETFAGQIDILNTRIGNLKERIGIDLIPVLSDLVELLGQALDRFEALPEPVQETSIKIGTLAVGLVTLRTVLGPAVSLLAGLGAAVGVAAAAPWIVLGGSLAALATGIGLLIDKATMKPVSADLADYLNEVDLNSAAVVQRMSELSDEEKQALGFLGLFPKVLHDTEIAAAEAGRAVAGIGLQAMISRVNLQNMKNVLSAQAISSFDDIQRLWKTQTDAQRPWPFGERGKPTGAVLTAPAKTVDTAWKSAFENIKGYAQSAVSSAQSALSGLIPSLTKDLNAPGANGPFENIFRAADIAVHGDQSQWAAKLGLDQATAQKIVADFQAGLFTEEVKALIDVPALVNQVQTKALADQLTQKFAEDIAKAAGVGAPVVSSLLGIEQGANGEQTVMGMTQSTETIMSALSTEWTGKLGDAEKLGVDFLTSLGKGIESAKDTLVTTVVGVANAMLNAMREALNVTVTSNGGGGAGENAMGTSFWRGGLSWVGERGPELVNLPRGSQVYPAGQSRAMAQRAGASWNVTINVSGANDPKQTGREVELGMLRAARSIGSAW